MIAIKTHNIYSDEWYTDRETVEKALRLFPCKPTDTIMLPFDTDQSEFVKVLKERGYKIIYNITDFLTSDYTYDYLITNPPFSIKDKVLEKCVKSGKPSTLILPIESLGGVKRHELYKGTNLKVYIPTRRINYYDEDGQKRKGSSFHSIILHVNADTTSIIYEYQEKEKP